MRRRLPPAARCGVVALVALVASTFVPVSARGASAASSPTFRVHPSVDQIAVTGAPPGAGAVLRDERGRRIAGRTVDSLGSTLFRGVEAGPGYVVSVDGASASPVSVLDPSATPSESFYADQHLGSGYGYLKTRDGTLLSVDVHLPGPAASGPYPTVVEYSGYDASNPNDVQPASRVAQLLGFATVGVNLRGTGCSGGAYSYFEELESLDGYDAIEAIAAQPWVQGGAVGMVGISYPGITQLFVAKTRPPHLAAITPLSVLDDTYDTLYPGGVFNNGFALGWARAREADARPATRAGEGQKWARQRIAAGDEVCRANQSLRLQSADVGRAIEENAYRRGAASDALAPASFVHDIDVPVFLAGTWQDQETGSHFADMLGSFSPAIPMKVTLMNGIHQDSIGPAVLSQWIEFLDFYVAKKIPSVPPATRAIASVVLSQLFGPGATLAPDRFTDQPDYASALRAYEAEPRVRVLFDVGAGGSPMPTFSTSSSAFPLPDTAATTWYLDRDGTLTAAPPTTGGADRFEYDPGAFPRTMTTVTDGLSPRYGWKVVPRGKALAYVTAPLTSTTVLAGTGSIDLWVQSSKPDVDLEVTISEVRPDGQETYVQSGWLRASQRALDPAKSTPLLPVQTHTKADVRPLSTTAPSLVRVALYPFAHAFRAGSRIRIVVQPPGGNRPAWAFADLPGKRTVTVSRSAARPSKVVLPVVPGIDVSTPLPACGTLRGQPCRAYEPLQNGSGDDERSDREPGTPVSNEAGAERPGAQRQEREGMSSPVDDLAEHYVARFAALDPLAATGEGIRGHDHEMTDYSPDGASERAELDRSTLRALDRAEVRSDADRIAAEVMRERLQLALTEYEAGERLRDLRVLGSPVQTVRMAFDLMPRETADDWHVIAERMALVPEGLSSIEAALAEGAAAGVVAARRQAVACTKQADTWGGLDPDTRPFFHALVDEFEASGVTDGGLRTRLETLATRATEAYASLGRFLVEEYAPRADERDPVGRERYSLYAQDFNGIELDLDETYAWGWDELHRIEHAMGQVAERIIPGADVDTVIEHLETDPARAIEGVDAFLRWNQELLDTTVAELHGTHFDIPKPVQRVEAMIAPPGGAAAMYYTGPTEDFSRPGRTWYPTLGKTRFPLWGEVSICYHEGVPGHHLQIGQVRYLAATLSRFQRTLAGTSGHAEGWALYAERLMGELGFLDDPAYELGMLRAQAMRAVRVVVDIGMHLELPIPADERYHPDETWTPELALPFVIERSKFPADFMASEVDRYLGLPGQAISYKVGERVWLGARDAARERTGPAFDLKAFHRAALDLGPMGLAQLDRELARL